MTPTDNLANPEWVSVDYEEKALQGDAEFVLSTMADHRVINVDDLRRLPDGDWAATVRLRR